MDFEKEFRPLVQKFLELVEKSKKENLTPEEKQKLDLAEALGEAINKVLDEMK